MKDLEFDVIIVGSGVGGATCADYLTRDNPNLKVAMIESGAYRTKENFNQKEIDMTAMYYNRGALLSKNLQIGVAAANTLGGSSAVYTGVSFRPPASVLENWRDEFGLCFLSQNYANTSLDEIEKEIGVHELPSSWDNDNNQLFQLGCDNLGIATKRLKINLKNCQQQGFCNLGCTTGGKQGTLEVQIPKLLSRGVHLFCNSKVIAVEENCVQVLVTEAPKDTKANSLECGNYIFKAKKIILAAGALHTPALLLKSAKKLNLKNDNIGRYLTLHPAFNVNGILNHVIGNYRGFPKTAFTDQFSDSQHFLLETSFYFPGVTAKNIAGYGLDHQEIMKHYSKMMSILILVHDKAECKNRIRINRQGNPIIDYTVSDDTKKALISAIHEASKIFFAAGCEKVLVPASAKIPLLPEDVDQIEQLITQENLNLFKTPLSSAHPQGGARMGKDKSQGVCDVNGKVFGAKSIYVSDASLFPTSVKVNPYETVMLLAKRVAEEISI